MVYILSISLKITYFRLQLHLPGTNESRLQAYLWGANELTHSGWMTQICVSKLTIIGLDNGLSPDQRQAIIWTNTWILSIRLLGTNFSEILIEIHTFSSKKILMKMSSGRWWPFCPSLNVLKDAILPEFCDPVVIGHSDPLNTLRPRQNGCHFADDIF